MDLVSNKVDTGGKRLNLFPAKKQKKKLPVDDKVFNMMEAVADKSYVNISDMSQLKVEKSTKSIHNALLVAGMTPAYGNIADVADATLYALEGEFGEAAWSMAAAIPVIGQMVAGRRAAKVAKEAGEKMVTVYRGVDSWKKSRHVLTHSKTGQRKIIDTGDKMVKEGRFVGGGEYIKKPKNQFGFRKRALWATTDKNVAKRYIKKSSEGIILEFEVPEKWFLNNFQKTAQGPDWGIAGFFNSGLPKEFLKKVHK